MNRSTTMLICSLVGGGLVSSIGLASAVFLWRGGVPVFAILLLSNVTTGVIAGSLFLQKKIRELEKQQTAAERLSKIADVNHHVRNALAVIAFYGTEGRNTTATQLVLQAVKRIDWTLREVLPKGWDVRTTTRMESAVALARERRQRLSAPLAQSASQLADPGVRVVDGQR